MVKNFLAYDLAVQLYKQTKELKLPYHNKDQLLRAAQSVALNLREGTSRPTLKDKQRFYAIAFGSIKEVQAIFDLIEAQDEKLLDLADHVAACTYKLAYRQPGP